MLVTDAVRRIKRQFGDEYDVFITDDDIYGWIYAAELDIIRNAGANDSTVDSTVGAFPVSVPAAVKISRVSINGSALRSISKEELDLVGVADTVNAAPSYWYMFNKLVNLYPQEAGSTTAVKITYSKTPVMMVGLPSAQTFSVPENFHQDVVNFCLARAHNKNNDARAEEAMQNLYDRALGLRNDEAQTNDGPTYKLDDPMDYPG
ncbi:MAG: hypothetical protein H0V81_17645 [Solirubrobacterales bacterium]|nr:hypothetical protein [Solirubrobacterales bacterium]